MTVYTTHLTKADEEIRAFALTDAGRGWEPEWYERLIATIDDARKQTTDRDAELCIETLVRMLCDSGPTEIASLPAINRAQVAMQTNRKQRQKTTN